MILKSNATRRAASWLGLAMVAIAATGGIAGCSDRQDNADNPALAASDDALPTPERAGGNVTGMPGQPGPGQVGPPRQPASNMPPETAIDSEGNLVDPGGRGSIEDANLPPLPNDPPGTEPLVDGPGADEAVAVVRAYYEAINAGSYGRAYTLWSDGGNASGQSPQQFADGFDDTREVAVEFMAPGRIDAAAGSRYIEVPVALRATRDDGSVHHYVGAYTLRRAVVDGASEEQRAWRIAAADIREVQP
ncbi:hypothetical protein [Novilysobacter erysipheiresistens]|uniref:Lipoprotein n=1 Tax=Novilysobacter erysipheiresistens TaxID=1749332 RepID=A0ABU7YUK2_9GAMM